MISGHGSLFRGVTLALLVAAPSVLAQQGEISEDWEEAPATTQGAPRPAPAKLSPPARPDLQLQLFDIRIESDLVRFRFTYDGPVQDFDSLEPAFHWLCETVGARVMLTGHLPQSRAVISISDQPVPFGEAAPGVEQFFEAFTVDGYSCAWEYF